MIAPDPARVLRLAVLAWGLGHLALGRRSTGAALLAAEVVAVAIVAWLTAGLADTSLYLVPFLGGVAFLAVWAWQAVHAYRAARRGAAGTTKSAPPLAIGWLTIPLLAWGAGFWLIGAGAATPAAALDRFVTDWTTEALDTDRWPAEVVMVAERAGARLGADAERFRDVRVRIAERGADRATAVAEAIHFERRESRFLIVFPGSELVPVADREVLRLDLVARAAELPGGGDVGAVRWEIVGAATP